MDQLHAQRFGQDTPIPSMQLCIESVDQSGGCGYGYSCVYTDTISWAAPTKPLPMIRDPRVVFDQMFGVLGSGVAGGAARAAAGRSQHPRLRARVVEAARAAGSAPAIACGSTIISTTSARSSGASRPSRSATTAASRASCRRRRDGIPGFVRRSRQADVRPADAGVPLGHHARVLVQARPRRLEPRLSGERLDRRVPHRVAPRREPGPRPRAGEDQRVSRQHAAVSPEAAERNTGRRRHDAG